MTERPDPCEGKPRPCSEACVCTTIEFLEEKMSERPDIDRLADTVRGAFGLDDPRGVAAAALDELVALAREGWDAADGMARAPYGEFGKMRERAEAAEARVAELERENDALRAEYENGENYILRSTHDAIVGRTARRVFELEAARDKALFEALYGDGGGA